MNKVYKSVFNVHTGTWVAVQETARARGKKSNSAKASVGMALALASSIVFSPTASAAPGDGVYFNDGADAGCVLIKDDSTASIQRITSGVPACRSTDKSTQTNRALFYSPGSGSTSLSLGGELYVNSGNLGLGGGTATKAMRIGSDGTLSQTTSGTGSIAIGSGSALASGLNSIAMGAGSVVAAGADSLAFGMNATSVGKYTISIGT